MSTPASLSIDDAASLAKADPILSRNTEPGFANTYGPGTDKAPAMLSVAAPALGVGALGLYLLYQKYRQDQQDQQENDLGLRLPQEKIAKIDWNAVKAQLPGLHAPDLLLGGAAGAGAGMLYDYIRGSEKGKRAPAMLRRALLGALLGAGATNLAGDRVRRYLTNSVAGPYGYDADRLLSQLKPRSLAHVRDALIYDKPHYDQKELERLLPTFGGDTKLRDLNIAARRELNRRSMHLHRHDRSTSLWQKNKGDKGPDYYSLNEQNPNYEKNVQGLMLPTNWHPLSVLGLDEAKALGIMPPDITQDQYDNFRRAQDAGNLFKEPDKMLRLVSQTIIPGTFAAKHNASSQFPVLGDQLMGGRQILTQPAGEKIRGAMLDRYDITPDERSRKHFYDALTRGRILSSKWRQTPANTSDVTGYTRDQSNGALFGGTLGRMLWDRILTHEQPWVAQKFEFSPVAPLLSTGGPEYGLQFMRNDGTPVGPVIDRNAMFNYSDAIRNHQVPQ